MQLSWKGLFISCSHMLLPLTLFAHVQMVLGPLWSLSYSSWIYNYLCNQCISPITLWVWTPLRWGVLDTMLCDKICQWLAAGQWFSPGTLVSSTNKTDCHDITEILLKVALSTINQTKPYVIGLDLIYTWVKKVVILIVDFV